MIRLVLVALGGGLAVAARSFHWHDIGDPGRGQTGFTLPTGAFDLAIVGLGALCVIGAVLATRRADGKRVVGCLALALAALLTGGLLALGEGADGPATGAWLAAVSAAALAGAALSLLVPTRLIVAAAFSVPLLAAAVLVPPDSPFDRHEAIR